MQKQMAIQVTEPCHGCGRQPKGWMWIGPDVYFIECSRCEVRASKCKTINDALRQWEAMQRTATTLED